MSFSPTEPLTQQRGKLFLMLPDGQVSQELILEKSSSIIGRSRECDIVIENDNISREHARILYTPEGFFVSDLGSTNGTFLNGYLVKPERFFKLGINDRLDLGSISLVFQLEHCIVRQHKLNKIESLEEFPLKTASKTASKIEQEKKQAALEIKDLGLTFCAHQVQQNPKAPGTVNLEQSSSQLEKLNSETNYYFPQASPDSLNQNQEFLFEKDSQTQALPSFDEFEYKLGEDQRELDRFVQLQTPKGKQEISGNFLLARIVDSWEFFLEQKLELLFLASLFMFSVFYFKFRPVFG